MRAHLSDDTKRRTDDEGMALMTAVLLIMVIGAMSVLMLGVVVAQVQPTMFAAKNSRTIVAAEAGVDAALSQMRSATSIDAISHQVLGDPRKLPCTVQGAVNGVSTDYSYRVQISYFDEDPKGQTDAWRAANVMTCGALGLTVAPSFAVISSEGLDAGVPGLASTAGDRTLETIYTFQVVNNNIEGGAIYSFGVGTCLQADGQVAGSTITYVSAELCRTDDPRRLWSWKSDYGIHLAVTDLAGATPLCITGRPSSGSVNATLQACTGASNQLFSWHGGALFKVQNADNSNYSSFCLGTGSSSNADPLGRKLMVGACGNNAAWSSFDPDARVGAAKASVLTKQIVNFLEFGRCFDVTQQQVGKAFMIVYPCKQDPSSGGGKLDWNHEWYYSEPAGTKGSLGSQQIYVLQNKSTSQKYCLKTPSPTASPAYVTLTSTCSGLDVTWTRDADTGVYGESWRFRDRYNRCISIGPKPPYDSSAPDLVNWSTIIVAACSGEPAQKWNAPAISGNASLDNYRELAN